MKKKVILKREEIKLNILKKNKKKIYNKRLVKVNFISHRHVYKIGFL